MAWRVGRRPKNAKVFVRGLLQAFNERLAFGAAALEVAGVSSPELLTMTKILEYHALVVAKAPSKAAQQALAIVKSAVRVAGSAPLAAAPEDERGDQVGAASRNASRVGTLGFTAVMIAATWPLRSW